MDMSRSPLLLPTALIVYILASRLALRWLRGPVREVIVAILNVACVYLLFFSILNNDIEGREGLLLFIEYFSMIILQYVLLRLFSDSPNRWLVWLPFFMPIVFLVLVRYAPSTAWQAASGVFHALTGRYLATPHVIGLSYMAFRCSYLVLEVRNGTVPKPGVWEYLSFSFFLPTMSLGPINTYANFRRGFGAVAWDAPVGRSAFRCLVGGVKYYFLGGLCNQLTYGTWLLNNHPHHWFELPIAMVFYYFYLYCNFSGFCDMAIGAAGIMGIPVAENFNNPFAARNVKDFWNRWHITLSTYMRDIVFAPLSKCLVRSFPLAYANHAIALTITVVFFLVGVWHGVGWNYFIFGSLQALGVVSNHYYTIGIKKWLGREGFKAYTQNPWIRAVAIVLTFIYCAASLMFFSNTLVQLKQIFHVLR